MNGKRPRSKTFVGTVFRLTGNKLTVKLRDGMTSRLEEIHIGQNIRVTTRKKDFTIAAVNESLRNNADFPSVTAARGSAWTI